MNQTDISLAEVRFPDGRKLYAAFNTDTDSLVTRSLMPLMPHELDKFDDEVTDLDPAQYLATLHVAKHQMSAQKRDGLLSVDMSQHMAESEDVEVYIPDYEEGFTSRANFSSQVLTGTTVMQATQGTSAAEDLVTRTHVGWAMGGLALSLLPVTFMLATFRENVTDILWPLLMVDVISVVYVAQPLAFFKTDALPITYVFQKAKEIKYVGGALFILGTVGVFFMTAPETPAREVAGYLALFGFLFGMLAGFAAYGLQLATSILKPKGIGSNQ